jgi:hypothetical protein
MINNNDDDDDERGYSIISLSTCVQMTCELGKVWSRRCNIIQADRYTARFCIGLSDRECGRWMMILIGELAEPPS